MFYKHLTSCFYRIPFKASFFQFHCVALHALCVNVFVVPVIELLMQLVASENSVKEVRVPTIIEFEKYKGYPISSIIELYYHYTFLVTETSKNFRFVLRASENST